MNNSIPKRSKSRKLAADALKTLEAPMRSRGQEYRSVDGLHADKDAITWYWKVTAVVSSVMILGGFLMLPAVYAKDNILSVDRTAIGIFGIAILTGGFAFSALLTFTIRNPLFQADSIHQPCALSSGAGLLNVFYNFIVSTSYSWRTSTLLLAIAAGLSTIVYTCLLLLSHRRISHIRAAHPAQAAVYNNLPLASASPARTSFASPAPTYEPSFNSENNDRQRTSAYQSPSFYDNYIRNMYPTSNPASNPGNNTEDLNNSIPPEEMQRQQMLMLLLANDDHQAQTQQSTYNIDWQGQEDSPVQGYYAPEPSSTAKWKGALRPWDGVWRGVARREERAASQGRDREERRREIEMGLR